MAGFRKAKAEQAALKVGLYGPPGSGKTFTALLLAEGLAKATKKRVAYVDTDIAKVEETYLRPNFSSTKDGSSIAGGQVVFSVSAAF